MPTTAYEPTPAEIEEAIRDAIKRVVETGTVAMRTRCKSKGPGSAKRDLLFAAVWFVEETMKLVDLTDDCEELREAAVDALKEAERDC